MMMLVELYLNNCSTISIALIQWQGFDISNIIAQSVTDPNVLGQMVSIWNTFIRSGQIWALIIGFVLGYLLRGITA
jgi:hypothetical protein